MKDDHNIVGLLLVYGTFKRMGSLKESTSWEVYLNVFDSPISIKFVPKVFSSYSSMVVKHWKKVENKLMKLFSSVTKNNKAIVAF